MNIDQYQFKVFFSEEDGVYVSTVAEFPYLSADGATPGLAIDELRSVVAAAVEVLESEGKETPVPLCAREFKGNISLRLSSETHRLAAERAREEGCSLNQFLTSLIEKNIYADRIETAIRELGRVVSEIEVNQYVRELASQAAPTIVDRKGRSSYQGNTAIQIDVSAAALDVPFFNTVVTGQGGV